MANKHKGETTLTIGDITYTLYSGTNAMELLEEHFTAKAGREVGWEEIYARVLGGKSLRYLKAFVWAALQKYHQGTTLEQAGDLIDSAGGITQFADRLAEAAGVSLPNDADLKALGIDAERPQTAQKMIRRKRARNTGMDSSATVDASV
jgi:hypothetical protein